MRRVRSWSAGVLLIIGVVLSPVAMTGVWAKSVVTDSDAYVESVAPLASDPAVTDALEVRLVDAVMDAVEKISSDEQVDEYLSDLNLPPAVEAAITGGLAALTEALREPAADVIHELVDSQGFVSVWEQVNRVAHEKFIDVMENESALLDTDGNLVLQLEPLLELVRAQLVSNGHQWADGIPASEVSFVLAESDDVDTLRSYYDLLSRWTVVAVIVTVCALVGAVLLARDRRRGALRVFASLAVVMVVFRLLLGFGVDAAGDHARSPEAVSAIFGAVAADLTDWIRLVAVAALLGGLLAFTWDKRDQVRAGIERMRGAIAHPPVLRTIRTVSAVLAVVGAGWLLFADHRSALAAVLIALVVLGAALLAAMPDRFLLERRSSGADQTSRPGG